MSVSLTDLITGTEDIGIGAGILPPSTTVAPSAQTGSNSDTATPKGVSWFNTGLSTSNSGVNWLLWGSLIVVAGVVIYYVVKK